MSGNSITRQQAGLVRRAKTSCRHSAISLGSALMAISLYPGQEKRTIRESEGRIGNSRLLLSVHFEGKMLEKITRKHRVGAIALLPLFLFAFPHFVAAQSDGQKLFDTNCAKCHGPDGTGNTVVEKAVGAKDLGSPEAKKLTDAEIYTQIDQGKGISLLSEEP